MFSPVINIKKYEACGKPEPAYSIHIMGKYLDFAVIPIRSNSASYSFGWLQ